MTPRYDSRYFQPVVIDLLQKLLCKDGNLRLGANGAEEIKMHPWFRDINWQNMEAGIICPPYDPSSNNDINMHTQSDIGVYKENLKRTATLPRGEDEYDDWDYTSLSFFFAEIVDWFDQHKDSVGIRVPVSTDANASCCNIC